MWRCTKAHGAPCELKALLPVTAGAEHFTMSVDEAALAGVMLPEPFQDAPVRGGPADLAP